MPRDGTKIKQAVALQLLVACVACVVCNAPAGAQSYPAKPIKVIVPMQAGTAGDSIMRIVAEQIAANVRQPLVIDNVTGAAGLIGAEHIGKAAGDGYTIGAMSDSMLTVMPQLQPGIKFDPLDGFEPVSMVASITSVLVVTPSLPVKSVEQLVALAKLHPGAMDFASGGIASQQHVAMAFFTDATGISLNHIPFRGASQAVVEVVGGRVPVMFVALSIALPFIKDGRLRVIAVASKIRSPLLPDVPSLSESGLPGFAFTPWVALYAPKGTPKAIVDRLHQETVAALQAPAVRSRLMALGIEPESSTPQGLDRRVRDDYARVGKLIKSSGIRAE